MRFLLLPAGLLVVGCTGTDPARSTAPAALDTVAADPDASAARVDPAADAGPAPVYGVFLTSETYGVDFASATNADGAIALADKACATLAGNAGLANAARYQALLTAHDATGATDLGRLIGLRTIDAKGGSWCSIVPTSPPSASCGTEGVVFATTDDFVAGPLHALITDERGGVAPVQSHFLSGYYVAPGSLTGTDGKLRSCAGWSHTIVLDPAQPSPPPEDGFGLGDATPHGPDDASPYRWLGDTYSYCEARYRYPLLCLERP